MYSEWKEIIVRWYFIGFKRDGIAPAQSLSQINIALI